MQSELDHILAECFPEETPIKGINYKGFFVPETYKVIADSIENFDVRDDDVWVCSFPKTGTTWTQEMVWSIANNLDFEGAKVPLKERFPFLEFTGTTTTGWISVKRPSEERKFPDYMAKSVEYTANLSSPRFIKTHLPFHLLPRQLRNGEKNNKIIYVARNPKDVCISYYHHYKLLEAYRSNFENFCKLFLGDKAYYAPFWEHVLGYWEMKDKRNILCLKYEDMKEDLPSAIRKTTNFLGKKLSNDQVVHLQNHLNFSSMKKNPSVNNELAAVSINKTKLFGKNFVAEGEFIRKGIVGQWKETMSRELIEQFEEWTSAKLKKCPSLLDEFNEIK